MQYLFSVIHDSAGLATDDEMAAIDVFNERLQTEGYWVFAGGLAGPSSATVIDNRGGSAVITDGPFVESKEQMAGYFVVDCATPERAEEIAGRFPDARFAAVEVRPLMGGSAEDL